MTDTKTYPSPSILVREFHETFGHAVRTEPEFDVPERFLRVKLILEEAVELVEANKDDDLIEIADALADIVYVTYGAALVHGIDLDKSFNSTESPVFKIATAMASNRSKIRPLPTLKAFTRNISTRGIEKVAVQYSEAAKNGGTVESLRKLLVSLVSSCYSMALSLGINLDDVLAEVQLSNMSKLGADGKPIVREDGKILKGPNFFVPDIAKVLKAQEPLL